MTYRSQFRAFTSLIAFTVFVVGCTKTRDARLSDSEDIATFAIADFGTLNESGGFLAATKPSLRSQNLNSAKATESLGKVTLDSEDSSLPERLRFMLVDLEISGQNMEQVKIVFGVDSKAVTAYKVASDFNALTALEKQLAVSAAEVQTAIDMQKAGTTANVRTLATKLATAQKARIAAISNRSSLIVLVPIFKYDITIKGILERTKNELREETSLLRIKETEFSKATHLQIGLTSDNRRQIGGVDQKIALDQLYSADRIDGQVTTAAALQEQLSFKMQFIPGETQVLSKLDAKDMKVYEIIDISKLTPDELRLYKTNSANGEILACKNETVVQNTKENCVLRLVAMVPITYKRASLTLVDSKDNTSNSILIEDITRAQSVGLVQINRNAIADRARPMGLIDPLKTIKISDLSGEFYFRRTLEETSNMLTISYAGASGDLSVVRFELEKDRLVIRNQKALVQYIGQGPKDKEELMSIPVKYFRLDRKGADGADLLVGQLVSALKEDAEYLEIDWRTSTIPVSNSPLAYYGSGTCLMAKASQDVTNMDMRLAKDGLLNFSLEGSYTLNPGCVDVINTNSAYFSVEAQFSYNISERISFKRITNSQDHVQFAPNIAPGTQNAMNFSIFTLADLKTGGDIRPNREGSEVYKPVIHDFRNGKTLTYHIGGLHEASAERRAMIISAAEEVVAEWNAAFRRAFAGTENARTGDYIILITTDADKKSHIGDLDKNFLWFMEKEAENGLLGVAQPGPNPYSGTIVHNNVIVYTGNSDKSLRWEILYAKEIKQYEDLLKKVKNETLERVQKDEEAKKQALASVSGAVTTAPMKEQPQTPEGTAAVNNANQMTSYLQKLALSARPVLEERMTSKWASEIAHPIKFNRDKYVARNLVSNVKFESPKHITKRLLEAAFQSEINADPLLMDAVIARELARNETSISAEMKALLNAQADANIVAARFTSAAKKRGGCFMYSREHYGARLLEKNLQDLLKGEIKTTLSHEIGHAIGLTHNFKSSYDKKNFLFKDEAVANMKLTQEGKEKDVNDRNYSSVMDYMAASEQSFQGPGPYDVHALRAIYAGLVELSDEAKKLVQPAQNQNLGTIKLQSREASVKDGFISINSVKDLLGFRYSVDLIKSKVNSSGLLKYYGQCFDGQVGVEPGCARYDSGASATEIVQNTIQNYNRRYMVSYHAADRTNFKYSQKISMIRAAISDFRSIRGYLDDMLIMAIYGTYTSIEEFEDFRNASQIGYNFFHELIRTPDNGQPFGTSTEEISRRLLPVTYQEKITNVTDDGRPNTEMKTVARVLESRPVYDNFKTTDRLDSIGIGYDKAFAVDFLLTANPSAMTDDSQSGWISYNEFEQYFKDIKYASESLNMLTMKEIMTGKLDIGFFNNENKLVTVAFPTKINRMMLDGAVAGSLFNTNAFTNPGLNTYAEFFKVGTLKGGRQITDRATVSRLGQRSNSQVGVKFYATDSAAGSAMIIQDAARKSMLLENKEKLGLLIIDILNKDLAVRNVIDALAEVPANKGKTVAELVALGGEDLDAKIKVAAGKTSELLAILTGLNKNGLLVSSEDIRANQNLALPAQVTMVRQMSMATTKYFLGLKALLPKVPQKDLGALFQAVAQQKQANENLKQLDLMALTQEILYEAFKAQGTIGLLTANGKVSQIHLKEF